MDSVSHSLSVLVSLPSVFIPSSVFLSLSPFYNAAIMNTGMNNHSAHSFCIYCPKLLASSKTFQTSTYDLILSYWLICGDRWWTAQCRFLLLNSEYQLRETKHFITGGQKQQSNAAVLCKRCFICSSVSQNTLFWSRCPLFSFYCREGCAIGQIHNCPCLFLGQFLSFYFANFMVCLQRTSESSCSATDCATS